MVAKRLVEIPVCDVCGSDDGVVTVEMRLGASDVYEVELCDEHREPVRALAKKGRKVGSQRRAAKAQRPRKRVAESNVFEPFDFKPGS